MERVKNGEKYWYLNDKGQVELGFDFDLSADRLHFSIGNYFNTEYEAISMSRKFRAVLKGADVIEMPSEEEIKERLDTIMPHGPVESWCVEGYCKHILDWLKSKIVK